MIDFDVQRVLEEAVRLHQAGQLSEAAERYRRILHVSPNHVEAMQRLAIVLHRSRNSDEAIHWLTKAVELSPQSADCHANLGAVQASTGLLSQAIESFAAAIQLRPDVPQLHFNLANALRQLDRHEEAARAYGRAIELRPNWPDAHHNRAIALHRIGDLRAAIASYCDAVALAPGDADIRINLSAALQETGALAQALSEVEAARSIRPSHAPTHYVHGNALRLLGRSPDAIQAFEKAIALRPDYSEAYYSLGSALRDVQLVDAAVAAFNKAIELKPDYGDAWANLGAVLRDKGQLDESIAAYRKGLDLTPLPWIGGNLLYTLHFHPDYDTRRIYEEHVEWNERFAKPAETVAVRRASSGGGVVKQLLRIGYVSPDFRNHPVGRFVGPLLAQHDRRKFEVYCYSDTVRLDEVSGQLQRNAHRWHNTLGLSDEKLADLIRSDGVDILVDLSLHARRGRMMALARKPAPVQVTYLAYCSTSGLRTMDYRLSDPYLDPPGSDLGVYFEKTVRLRCYWCYPGGPVDLAVAAPPAVELGRVTFGCLNTFAKVTQPTLRAWFKILGRVPESRLVVHALEGDHRERVRGMAEAGGIDPGRIEFVGFLPGQRYFEAYNAIDIALDPFPYAGGTTSCDALWMGVPVVSLAGATAVSRGGLSILSAIGLAELASGETGGYVEKAVALARDLAGLRELRMTLRQKMQSSVLMDAGGFARDVEGAYRRMWQETGS